MNIYVIQQSVKNKLRIVGIGKFNKTLFERIVLLIKAAKSDFQIIEIISKY